MMDKSGLDLAARGLIDSARTEGIPLRLLGGLAVRLRCPSAALPALARPYEDIDLATDREGGRRLADFFAAQGFAPDRELNTLNGHRRQIYFHPEIGKVDVFVEEFEMCHRLPLENRLNLHPYAMSPADLFLTKAQIFEINRKDLLDLLAILLDHAPGRGEEELDDGYIAGLCARDWGLFTTVSRTLKKIIERLEAGGMELEKTQTECVHEAVDRLRGEMEREPKTPAWKLRAVIGKRQKWYLDVEEVER